MSAPGRQEMVLWILPFVVGGEQGEEASALWGRQFASLLAERLTDLGREATWAPMVARGDEGLGWLAEEEVRPVERVRELLGGTPATHAIDGALRVGDEVARAALRLVRLADGVEEREWFVEAEEPFALLAAMVREVAGAFGVVTDGVHPVVAQASRRAALEAWLADRDVEQQERMAHPVGRARAGAAERWRFLRRAAELDEGFVHARGVYVQRAIAHSAAGLVDDALEAMGALEEAVGASAELDGAVAEVLIAGKRWDDAEQRLRSGIERDGAWAWGHHRLGHLRLLAEDHGEAAGFFERAHALEPGNAWTRTYLAVVLDELGRHGEADGHWAAVLGDPGAPPKALALAATTREVAHARRGA